MAVPFRVAARNEESHKGQDRHATLEAGVVSAFGVYDGHGGTECAEALKEGQSTSGRWRVDVWPGDPSQFDHR